MAVTGGRADTRETEATAVKEVRHQNMIHNDSKLSQDQEALMEDRLVTEELEVRWLDQERDSMFMDHFEGKGGLGGNGGRGGDGGDAAGLFLPFEYNLVENNLDEVTIELLVRSSLSRLFSLLVLHVMQNSNKLFLMLSSPV